MTVLVIHEVDGGLTDAARAALVFEGALVVHRVSPASRALLGFAAAVVREHFGEEPELAHECMDRAAFLATAAAAQAAFERSRHASDLWRQALAAAGIDARTTLWDKRALRVLPSGDGHGGGRLASTHVHRDTWGSNIHEQVNWWMTLYPLAHGRTIAFYPQYWSRPLANSSADWRFEDYLAARCAAKGDGVRPDYPAAPEPLEPVAPASAVPVVIEPGELLCFSGAHLHVGVPNRTGRTRFSLETRTVARSDRNQGRCAPDVDGSGARANWGWFSPMDSCPARQGPAADPAPRTSAGRRTDDG